MDVEKRGEMVLTQRLQLSAPETQIIELVQIPNEIYAF